MTHNSGWRPVLQLIGLVFLVEFGIMWALSWQGHGLAPWMENVADATVLVTVLAPFIIMIERRRERAERDARAYSTIVRYAEDGAAATTPDGIVTSWNGGAERITGYGAAEAIGQPPVFFLHPDSHGEAAVLVRQVASGERISKKEIIGRRKDGSRVDHSVSIAPIADDAGAFSGISVVFQDISERKRADAERERLLAEKDEALANVRKLSGLLPMCSHCKRIRGDDGDWSSVDVYIRDHSEAVLSHGICPDCSRTHFPEYGPVSRH